MNTNLIKALLCSVIGLLCSNIVAMSRLQRIMGHIAPAAQTTVPASRVTLGARPTAVQEAGEKSFEALAKERTAWLYNGSSTYGLLGIDDGLFLKDLACANPEKKDVYIIDVGCANAQWGRSATDFLSSEACQKSGKRFHIFSLTGSTECATKIERVKSVTHYQFNQFNIENLDKELLKRGFDLKNKADLIVSNWTLRHLVDPFGTLKRMYGLLTPAQGKLLSNGFLFKFNDSDEIQGFPNQSAHILASANAIALFRNISYGRDAGHFMLMRNDDKELAIPLSYAGGVYPVGHGWQCGSRLVTVFNKEGLSDLNFKKDIHVCRNDYGKFYSCKGNVLSKQVYLALKSQGKTKE